MTRREGSSACIASTSFAVLGASLLRYLLGIPSQPFDLHSGWRVFAGWLVVYFALFALGHALVRFLLPPAQQSGPDAYTLAQAEVAAERGIRPTQ